MLLKSGSLETGSVQTGFRTAASLCMLCREEVFSHFLYSNCDPEKSGRLILWVEFKGLNRFGSKICLVQLLCDLGQIPFLLCLE